MSNPLIKFEMILQFILESKLNFKGNETLQ